MLLEFRMCRGWLANYWREGKHSAYSQRHYLMVMEQQQENTNCSIWLSSFSSLWKDSMLALKSCMVIRHSTGEVLPGDIVGSCSISASHAAVKNAPGRNRS